MIPQWRVRASVVHPTYPSLPSSGNDGAPAEAGILDHVFKLLLRLNFRHVQRQFLDMRAECVPRKVRRDDVFHRAGLDAGLDNGGL